MYIDIVNPVCKSLDLVVDKVNEIETEGFDITDRLVDQNYHSMLAFSCLIYERLGKYYGAVSEVSKETGTFERVYPKEFLDYEFNNGKFLDSKREVLEKLAHLKDYQNLSKMFVDQYE